MANHKGVKFISPVLLEDTSNNKKRGCNYTCSNVMRIRILQMMDRGRHIGYYLCV